MIGRLLADVREGRRGALLLVEGVPGVGHRRFLQEIERSCQEVADCMWLSLADAADPQSAPWRAVADRHVDGERISLLPASGSVRPLVVIVSDGCAVVGPGRHRWESLLDGLDQRPLLFVVAVVRDHQTGLTPLPFRRWLTHPNVVHLRLEALAPEVMAHVVRSRRPQATTEEVATVVRVAKGIPAVATELCRWHERTTGGSREMSDADVLAVAPLLARRIGTSPAVRVLEVSAAAEGPIHASRVAEILEESTPVVRTLLDEAVTCGLLVRDETSAITGYTVGHPLVRALVRGLAGERRWAEVNRCLAEALIADAGEADLAGPRATVIARHLAASADRPADAARYFRYAAQVAQATEDLEQARRWAGLGLAGNVDRQEECRLLMIIGSVDERLGAVAQGISTLRRAYALALETGDGALLVEAAVRLLDASRVGKSLSANPRPSEQVAEQVMAAAEAAPPALRTRLHAHLAILDAGRDEEGYRQHLAIATSLAGSLNDGAAVAAVIAATAARPLPSDVERHLRLAQDGLALTGGDRLSALPAAVFANLALGRPAAVEMTLEQFAAIERAHPCRWARAQLAVAAMGLAVLSLDEARFVAAVREVAAETSSEAFWYGQMAVEVWEALTGRPLAGLPRSLAELSGQTTVAALAPVVRLLSPRLSGLVSDTREGLDIVLAEGDAAVTRPRDATWSTWVAAALRTAMWADRSDLCRLALGALLPYADQFVVLGHALPIGPVGWYVASALQWFGRTDEALEANARADAASRRARSCLWVIHSHLQRAELTVGRDPRTAQAIRQAAVSYAQVRGMGDVIIPRVGRPDGAWPAAVDPRRRAIHGSVPTGQQQTPTGLNGVRAAVESLGSRDLSILLLLKDGASNAMIAEATRLSIPTVERRLSRLYRTLGTSNRAHAAAVVTRLGIDVEWPSARPDTCSRASSTPL